MLCHSQSRRVGLDVMIPLRLMCTLQRRVLNVPIPFQIRFRYLARLSVGGHFYRD